jgi:hypothetical protein
VATTVVTPTFKDVQWLADRPRGEGMVVSCYVDTSVVSGVRPLWREHLKNMDWKSMAASRHCSRARNPGAQENNRIVKYRLNAHITFEFE